MKMIAEYLEHAVRFEQMAAAETDPELKARLLEQAKAYRKLADERATRLGIIDPSSGQLRTTKNVTDHGARV
jgi:hypothetical protein